MPHKKDTNIFPGSNPVKLFTIGPTQMFPEVIAVRDSIVPYFRNDEFSDKMFFISNMLKKTMNADENSVVIPLTASGTAAMEATIINCFSSDDRLLVINGGTFGKRFCALCEFHNISYDSIDLSFNEVLRESHFSPFQNTKYTACLVNLHETSTGQLYDISLISEFCQKKGMFLIVDAISTYLCDRYDMKGNQIDATIISSQKGLCCSPGVSFIVFSTRLDEYRRNKVTNKYFEFKEYISSMEVGQTPYTPAVGIMIEIYEMLKKIEREGIESILVNAKANAEFFRKNCDRIGAEYPKTPLSNALTLIRFKTPIAKDLIAYLSKHYNLYVNPCSGDMAEDSIRVAHVGDLTINDHELLLQKIEEFEGKKSGRNIQDITIRSSTPSRAVLLAGGVGSRISEINVPKCTLKVGDKSVLERTVDLLKKNNIKICVVTGYKNEEVNRVLKAYDDILIYYNPFFRVTNSIAGLWYVQDFAFNHKGDLILANADVVWDQYIFDQLMKSKKNRSMIVDSSKVKEGIGDFFFKLNDDEVIDYGKTLSLDDRDAEYIGVARIVNDEFISFRDKLNDLILSEHYDMWWENVLYEDKDKHPINTIDLRGHEWGEIDSMDDYIRLQRMFESYEENV